MWHIIGAALVAFAAMAITIALVASAGAWFLGKPEALAVKYGRGPFTAWLIEWGLFAGFLFGELVFVGAVLVAGILALTYFEGQ